MLIGLPPRFAWAAVLRSCGSPTGWPRRWMARLVVSGVVAGLPQAFERGVRFDSSVESPGTGVPRRIVLSSTADSLRTIPQGVLPVARRGSAGRFTWRLRRPHGSANPHGIDAAWLLERGVRATLRENALAPRGG